MFTSQSSQNWSPIEELRIGSPHAALPCQTRNREYLDVTPGMPRVRIKIDPTQNTVLQPVLRGYSYSCAALIWSSLVR